MRASLLMSLTTFSINAFCEALPPTTPVPGGVVVLPLLRDHKIPPTATFGSQRIMVVKAKRRWYGIIGLSRDQIPGEYIVTAYNDASSITSLNFKVHARRQKDPGELNSYRSTPKLTEDERSRWKFEQEKLLKIMGAWTKKPTMDLKLKYPVSGSLMTYDGNCGFASTSGLKIDGLTFIAAAGTKLVAPSDAIVIAAGSFTIPGSTVILDHGQGMISLMCYLENIMVKKGQKVAKGTHLGDLGVNPQSNESKTDWIVMLNGSWVNPDIFLPR